MSKNIVPIVIATFGGLFFYICMKLGNNYNLDTKFRSDNIPLFSSHDESGKEEIMGGSRKQKNKKRGSKKYFKNK